MMRLRACMSGLLLIAAGCAQLPAIVRIEVDGRMIELRQQGFSPVQLPGAWSTSQLCGPEVRFDLSELHRSVSSIRVAGPDRIEVIGPEGKAFQLQRCVP
jgi:hypothetical protein